MTPEARERIATLQAFADLGSGFSVASHDLEIRGAGDLLGAHQSGQIAAVGLELYTELLDQAIEELRGHPIDESDQWEPEIRIPVSAMIPESYIPHVNQRLVFYKKISSAKEEPEIQEIEKELADRYGPIPPEVFNLFWMIKFKWVLKKLRVKALALGTERISLNFDPQDPKAGPLVDRIIQLVTKTPSKKQPSTGLQINPDGKLIIPILKMLPDFKEGTPKVSDIYFGLEKFLDHR